MGQRFYNMEWDPAIESRKLYRCQWFREGKIPGAICDICEQTWSLVSGRRLARKLPDDPDLKRMLLPKPVPLSRHGEIYRRLREALKLEDDIPVFPGLDVGLGSVKIEYSELPDFIWPTPWTILLSPRSADRLAGSGLSGFEIVPVGIKKDGVSDSDAPDPELSELTIHGIGGPAGEASGITVLDRCYVCGFTRYSEFSSGLHVNPTWWDGTDFFLLDEYPTYVLVSDRAKRFLEGSDLTNIRLLAAEALPYVGPVKK